MIINHRLKLFVLSSGVMLSFGAFGMALLLQHYYNLTPCPLCIFSRMLLIGLGCFYSTWLLQSIFSQKTRDWLYFSLLTLGVGSGLLLSGYHNWLLSLPLERMPSCGPSLDYLLDILPLYDALILAFKGSGSCAQETFRWMGFNLAELELGVYLMLSGLQIYLFLKK